MTNPPTRHQQLHNAAIALCDQLPPAYAGQIITLTTAVADRARRAAVYGPPAYATAAAIDYAAAAADALIELVEEITEALTTRAREIA